MREGVSACVCARVNVRARACACVCGINLVDCRDLRAKVRVRCCSRFGSVRACALE